MTKKKLLAGLIGLGLLSSVGAVTAQGYQFPVQANQEQVQGVLNNTTAEQVWVYVKAACKWQFGPVTPIVTADGTASWSTSNMVCTHCMAGSLMAKVFTGHPSTGEWWPVGTKSIIPLEAGQSLAFQINDQSRSYGDNLGWVNVSANFNSLAADPDNKNCYKF